MLPEVEKREIKNTIKRMIDEFRGLRGMNTDVKEQKYKEILDYLLTKTLFLASYPRFKTSVLYNISYNAERRGYETSNINYDYYYGVIQGII